jgi:hypothetical protein
MGDEHNLNAALNYNYTRSTNIVEDPDVKAGGEPIVSHAFTLSVEYVPIARLALAVSLPFMGTEYQGTGTLFPRHGSYDDGKMHYTLQDFAFQARYQVLVEPVTLTPLVSVSIPVANYESLGYANAGRHLKQLHAGLAFAKFFGDLYVHAQYEFTLSEKYDKTPDTKAVGQDRSDMSLNLGYELLDNKLDINVGANFRLPHGGINFSDYQTLPADIQMYHDPLLKEEFLLLGPGITYAITDVLHVGAFVRFWVYGKNTRDANNFALDLSWDVI